MLVMFIFLKIDFYLWTYAHMPACECVYTCVCRCPQRPVMSWRWSYRQLWITLHVIHMGPELQFSERVLNCWLISLAPVVFFFFFWKALYSVIGKTLKYLGTKGSMFVRIENYQTKCGYYKPIHRTLFLYVIYMLSHIIRILLTASCFQKLT